MGDAVPDYLNNLAGEHFVDVEIGVYGDVCDDAEGRGDGNVTCCDGVSDVDGGNDVDDLNDAHDSNDGVDNYDADDHVDVLSNAHVGQ